MRVLHITPSFWPATYWGGPIFSVYGLCNALAEIPGVQLRVLTTDAAGPRWSQRVDVTNYAVRYADGYDVIFTRRIYGAAVAPGLLMKLWPMIRWADVVHLTATYSFPTIPTLLACRLLQKPLVWSPRGALQATQEWEDARRRKHKRIWEQICSLFMPRHSVLHVTSEAEKTASIARLPKAAARVIRNGVEVPESLPPRLWLPAGEFRLMFIGRLDPQKGIENLLVAFVNLCDPKARLDIYGSGDPTYAAKLIELARSRGLEGRISFHGHVDGEEKQNAFLKADICIVPSHTENFGMVVAEALANGVPVIASRRTPWADIETHGCGYWVDNLPASLARAISSMRNVDLAQMGENGRSWMKRDFSWSARAREMAVLYRELCGLA